jgi:hypothetical protein
MTHVDCFCGCCFSFDGGLGACPQCGEYVTFTSPSADERQQMHDELDRLINAVTETAPPTRSR